MATCAARTCHQIATEGVYCSACADLSRTTAAALRERISGLAHCIVCDPRFGNEPHAAPSSEGGTATT